MYDIVLFTADYPRIDPNVTHTREEIFSSGHAIFYSVSGDVQHNEAKDIFGIDISVKQMQYDMEKIQKEYHMKFVPNRHKTTDEFVIFSNDTENVSIRQNRAARYIVSSQKEQSVIYRKIIARWKDNGNLVAFLSGSMQIERGQAIPQNGIFLLSKEQLSVISAMVKLPEWMSYYNDEMPNVFISILAI